VANQRASDQLDDRVEASSPPETERFRYPAVGYKPDTAEPVGTDT
jgi:hypothetical protein